MKLISPQKTTRFIFPAITCMALVIIFFFNGCKTIKPWEDYIYINREYSHIPPDSSQQIIVWRTPGSNAGYLNIWLDSITAHCGPVQITLFCGSCDSSLMLLSGPGIKTYIQGNGGSKGGGTSCSSNCPPSGGGDTIYWCVNFPVNVDFSDSVYNIDASPKGPIYPGLVTDSAITVAVFDTGVDPHELSKYLYNGNLPCCLNNAAKNGWNYPDNNNNITDDYHSPRGHGAIVARLIAEQVQHYNLNTNVTILPVKIHNASGQSDLFSILCGFAYAKDRGAKIINASFGFYAPKRPPVAGAAAETDPSALLMKKYIQYYLTSHNILLIAAAGNKNDAWETSVFVNAGLPVPTDLRNLDNVYFYPASLAGDSDLPNVIAVTTVDKQTKFVSPLQNYSVNVVDIGVDADQTNGVHYFFKNPRIANGFAEGSSYATPIVTGIICAHYNLLKDNIAPASFNKDNILRFLLQDNMHVGQITTFGGKIKTGIMFNNAVR